MEALVFSYPSQLTFKRTPRRLLLGVGSIIIAAIALAILPGAPAQAASAGTCPSSALSQPFLKWGDSNFYELVAGGDFEGTLSGWVLIHGAQKASGSELYGATGKVGASSLALPYGASARSPFTCVTPSDSSFRFFARNEGPTASVLAEVVYWTPFGNVSVPVGIVKLSSGWQPTASMPTGAALAGALSSNGTAQLALRFTATTGSARIDDVFIDPRMR
jgi:hypothetical protein